MLQCGPLKSGHLPVVFAMVFFLNLSLTYILAVARGDVDSIFPYVSATGDHRPESCLFSLLLNFSSFLSLVIINVRYGLIRALILQSDVQIERINRISLFVGALGAFCMMVVASVQETAIIPVHLLAAVGTFGFGVLYMYMQAWITVKMYPNYNNKRIGIIRSVIAFVATVSFFCALGFGIYAAHVYHRTFPDRPTPRPWSRKFYQPGYEYHVVSAIFEWIMALTNVIFLLSYSRDFEKINAEVYVESLVNHLDHIPLHLSRDDL